MEHSPGNLQKGGIICYHLMMDVENQLLQEMNGFGQVYCLFTVFSMSDVSLCRENLCTSKLERLDANHDLEFHSLHYTFYIEI